MQLRITAASCAVVVVGTRRHLGIGGSMVDGLAARGVSVRLIELHRGARASLLDKGTAFLERLLPRLSSRHGRVNSDLLEAISSPNVRFVIATNGRELHRSTVQQARQVLEARGGGIACYLCDDPFNPAHRLETWIQSLNCYSVVVTTKRAISGDLRQLGCPRVEYARFGFNPDFHRPVVPGRRRFAPMDLAFAGNADADRLSVIGTAVELLPELRVTIYGDGWRARRGLRARCQPQVVGLDYAAAMCAATVCPCLVRRANRDGHVMRSFELPAIGAFMLAERTAEHQEIFEEGVHCEYWSSVEELVDKSRWFAAHPSKAAEIAHRGHQLVLEGSHTYADRAEEVIRMMSPGERSSP
jgi:hypothetical protein